MESLIEMSDEHEKNEETLVDILDEATNDEHFLKCMDYVVLRESRNNMSQSAVASYFNVTAETIRRWQIEWTQSGLLQKCRRILSISSIEEVRAAEYSIMRSWPAILERQRNIAINGKSDHNALESARFLYETIIQPAMLAAGEAGIDELDYIESITTAENKFDPFIIQQIPDKTRSDTSQS